MTGKRPPPWIGLALVVLAAALFAVPWIPPIHIPLRPYTPVDPDLRQIRDKLSSHPRERKMLASFFRQMANIVRRSPHLRDAGHVREVLRVGLSILLESVEYQAPRIIGENLESFLKRSLGLENQSLTPEYREKAAQAFEDIAKSLEG